MSLRAPRVAVCIEDDHYVPQTMSALRVHSQLWGGAGNTVVVSQDGQVHPGVSRALKAFDPDYVAHLAISAGDSEEMFPGSQAYSKDGRDITDPGERSQFIKELEEDGPFILGPAVSDDALAKIVGPLTPFQEFGHPRVPPLHPGRLADVHLSTVPTTPCMQITTGDPIIDLAIALKRGVACEQTGLLTAGKDIPYHEVVALLCGAIETSSTSPFSQTVDGLTWISKGSQRRGRPTIVVGRSGADMALAATLDRVRGETYWLPFTEHDGEWLRYLGTVLPTAGGRSRKQPFVVTSASLDENVSLALFRKFIDAGFMERPASDTAAVYYPAEKVPLVGRTFNWRLDDRWDLRFTGPITDDGSSTYLSTHPPLETPTWYGATTRQWITEVWCDRRPVHAHPSIELERLVAPGVDAHDMFIRTSGPTLSYESARWGMVLSGASAYGQLARPKLRWPGVLEALTTAAEQHGSQVRASAPGKIANLTTGLWGGRAQLIADLLPHRRPMVDRLLTPKGPDGPLEQEKVVGTGVPRIRLHDRCLVPYAALDGQVADFDAREWLDERVVNGAIRVGLILGCGVCPWNDFYPIDDVSSSFACVRCGSKNALTRARWRKPDNGPIWYYELHPTAAQFFVDHGDGPLLAVHHHQASRDTDEIQFELEFVDASSDKPWAEIDFAILSFEGLVLGEAKTNGILDGKTAKQRVDDAGKLLRAGELVGATEVCFATFGTWNAAARTAIANAMSKHRPRQTVTLLENIETASATHTTL